MKSANETNNVQGSVVTTALTFCVHVTKEVATTVRPTDIVIGVFRGDVRSFGGGNTGRTGMVPGTTRNDADASLRRRNGNQQSERRDYCLVLIF